MLAETEGGVVGAVVDATVHKKLAKRYNVDGYPYVKLFIGDEVRTLLVTSVTMRLMGRYWAHSVTVWRRLSTSRTRSLRIPRGRLLIGQKAGRRMQTTPGSRLTSLAALRSGAAALTEGVTRRQRKKRRKMTTWAKCTCKRSCSRATV